MCRKIKIFKSNKPKVVLDFLLDPRKCPKKPATEPPKRVKNTIRNFLYVLGIYSDGRFQVFYSFYIKCALKIGRDY